MAPLLFALALFAQDADPDGGAADAPVATAAPGKSTVAPLPIQGGPVAPPTDDYGYVGWCYGAVAGYLDLYDVAMPEVIRIERAWPTPNTEENIAEVYPAQREEAKADLKLFRRALEAAEKASPTPIQAQGTAAIKRGRGVWTGAGSVPKAQLAQFWMSWTPPAKCAETAQALETRSKLFGQALGFNTRPDAAAPPPPPPPPEPASTLALTAPGLDEAAPLAEPMGEAAPAAIEESLPAEVAAEADPAPEPATPAPATEGDLVGVAESAPGPAPAEAPADPATADGSAIDDLLSGDDAAEADQAVAAADAGETGPVVLASEDTAAEPAEAPAEPAAAAPKAAPQPAPAKPRPARKKGLRETLGGLRGRQE